MTARKTYALVLVAGFTLGAGMTVAGSAIAGRDKQPAMEAALMHLQKAKRKLENATSDKGGHRKKAIDLTGQAISEVQQGIAADDAN